MLNSNIPPLLPNLLRKIALCCGMMVQVSCIREAKNLVLPEANAQLGVTCFISPEDENILVTLSRSQKLGQYPDKSKIDALQQAVVELGDGTTLKKIPYDGLDFENNPTFVLDTKNFPVVPGNTYFLTVRSNDGEILTAHTTVPLHVNTSLNFKVSAMSESEMKESNDLPIEFEFVDLPETGNYYKVGMKALLRSPGCGYTGTVSFESQTDLVSDRDKNGQLFKIKDATIYMSCKPMENDSLQIILANTDYNYYRFFQTVESNTSDNPFKEPAPVFSNVAGGLGIFCSYRIHKKTLPLK